MHTRMHTHMHARACTYAHHTCTCTRTCTCTPPALASRRPRRRCDRVLWSSWPGCAAQLRQLHYTSVPQIVSSDHTPVVSSFALSLLCPRLESRSQVIPGLRLQLTHLRAEELTPHDANGLADPYVEVLHVPGTCAHYHPTLALLWPLHTGAARGLRDRQLLPHSPPAFPSHIPRPHSPAAFPCRCGRASHSRSACCPCAARRSAPRGRASGCSCLCPPRARGR